MRSSPRSFGAPCAAHGPRETRAWKLRAGRPGLPAFRALPRPVRVPSIVREVTPSFGQGRGVDTAGASLGLLASGAFRAMRGLCEMPENGRSYRWPLLYTGGIISPISPTRRWRCVDRPRFSSPGRRWSGQRRVGLLLVPLLVLWREQSRVPAPRSFRGMILRILMGEKPAYLTSAES